MTDISNLSSLEKLLLGIDQLEMQTIIVPLRKDSICPQCNSGKLDYNGLLQLECSACGFVNAEGGGALDNFLFAPCG